MLADQMLARLEYFHSRQFLHRAEAGPRTHPLVFVSGPSGPPTVQKPEEDGGRVGVEQGSRPEGFKSTDIITKKIPSCLSILFYIVSSKIIMV